MGDEEVRPSQISTLLIIVTTLILGFQNCSGYQTQADDLGSAKSLQEDISKLTVAMQDMNDDLSCVQDANCEAIAYGSRACGGPTGYMVVSNQSLRYNDIVILADELTEKEVLHNQMTGAVSTCEFLMPPTVSCIANTCK